MKNIDEESVRNIIDYYYYHPDDVDENILLQSKLESYTSDSEMFMLIYDKKITC